jgi:integrase
MAIMRGKITKRSVDALKPEDGTEVALWDVELKGFGIRVRSANVKVYVVRYRAGKGRGAPIRTFTIGRHGSPWTPEKAREEAGRILGIVNNGGDPAAERTADKSAQTVSDLCERFISEHVTVKRKDRTADEYERLMNRIVRPALGKMKIKDVSRQDIVKLHHDHRHTPYQANRTLAVLSKMFNLAEVWGYRADETNPCRHIEKFKEMSRERYLTPEELSVLGEALASYRSTSEYAVAAIKLLIFTGARLNEILTLRWEWVDLDRGEARLPDSKTGAKTIHFPTPALDILRDLPRFKSNPHVIVGRKLGANLVNLEKPWRAIREAATVLLWKSAGTPELTNLIDAIRDTKEDEPTFDDIVDGAKEAHVELPPGLTTVRIHDLRHGFASTAASAGMALPIIGKLLGHSQAQTTQRYAHLAADPLKAAAATVAGKIAEALNGEKACHDEVDMPERRS